MTSAPLLTLSLVALAMCASPNDANRPASPLAEPPPASVVPSRLRVTLGGGPGMGGPAGRSVVELRGDTLVYLGIARPFPTGPRPETRAVPTDAAWRAFRSTLDSLDAFAWRARYENPAVDDGTQWSADVAYPDAGLHATGSNRFPAGFEPFLDAVRRLGGRDDFRLR